MTHGYTVITICGRGFSGDRDPYRAHAHVLQVKHRIMYYVYAPRLAERRYGLAWAEAAEGGDGGMDFLIARARRPPIGPRHWPAALLYTAKVVRC